MPKRKKKKTRDNIKERVTIKTTRKHLVLYNGNAYISINNYFKYTGK